MKSSMVAAAGNRIIVAKKPHSVPGETKKRDPFGRAMLYFRN
jgi:hypothetical protein